MRVVDQALPADGRARFFEINAHDDFHPVGEFLAQGVQPLGIFQRAIDIVNGARADDDEQAGVFLPQNPLHRVTTVDDRGTARVCLWQLRLQLARRQQPDKLANV